MTLTMTHLGEVAFLKQMAFVIVYRTGGYISQYDLMISLLFSHGVIVIKIVDS